jgi:hypothetical protein
VDNFKRLVLTGSVGMVAEPYYRYLSILHDEQELKNQVAVHGRRHAPNKCFLRVRPKSCARITRDCVSAQSPLMCRTADLRGITQNFEKQKDLHQRNRILLKEPSLAGACAKDATNPERFFRTPRPYLSFPAMPWL